MAISLDQLRVLSRNQVQSLLRELKAEGRIHNIGRTRARRWYLGPAPEEIASKDETCSEKTQ